MSATNPERVKNVREKGDAMKKGIVGRSCADVGSRYCGECLRRNAGEEEKQRYGSGKSPSEGDDGLLLPGGRESHDGETHVPRS